MTERINVHECTHTDIMDFFEHKNWRGSYGAHWNTTRTQKHGHVRVETEPNTPRGQCVYLCF